MAGRSQQVPAAFRATMDLVLIILLVILGVAFVANNPGSTQTREVHIQTSTGAQK